MSNRWMIQIADLKTNKIVLDERVDRVTAVAVAKAVGDDEVADEILGDQQADTTPADEMED